MRRWPKPYLLIKGAGDRVKIGWVLFAWNPGFRYTYQLALWFCDGWLWSFWTWWLSIILALPSVTAYIFHLE